eukprot:Awhi_evm1s1351
MRVEHDESDEDAFYPINLLRNVGAQGVRSMYAFVLDVDVVPNAKHTVYQR